MPTSFALNKNGTKSLQNEGKGEKEVQAVEDEDGIPQDMKCGYGQCTPHWLQWMARPEALLVFLCCFTISQGFAVNGINNVNTSSMERRFRLPSSQVGLVSSAYDVSAGLSVIFVSYFGTHAHKPRLLGFAAISLAIGSLVMTMPHITAGVYEPSCAKIDTCAAGASQQAAGCQTDQEATSRLQNYLYVFIAGQVLHGLGGTCLYTLGTSFLDENVPTKSSPLFIGLMFGFSGLGPAIGYLLGGYFLDIYVDTPLPPVDDMTPSDPRWVGAWWIGFTISGSLFATVSLIMFALPRELPGVHKIKATRVSQAHGGRETERNFVSFREMPAAIWSLLKNPVFIFVSLAASSEGFATSGIATFLPKVLQNQFQLSSSFAAILAGLMSVPGAAGGNIVSGIICRKMKLKVPGMLRISIACAVVCIAALPVLLVNCGNSPFESREDLTASCNGNCGCTTYSFKPVCSNGVEYFSPCFAGCVAGSKGKDNSDTVYANCSCINSQALNATKVTLGKCDTGCGQLAIFIPLMFLAIFGTFFSTIPGNGVTMRCIPDSQRTFGLGIQWVFVRFLGTIPGPILFGKIVDIACVIWQDLDNEETGSCWVYDNDLMSRNALILCGCVKAATLTFFSLAYHFYKPPSAMSSKNDASQASFTGGLLSSPSSTASMNAEAYENAAAEIDQQEVKI